MAVTPLLIPSQKPDNTIPRTEDQGPVPANEDNIYFLFKVTLSAALISAGEEPRLRFVSLYQVSNESRIDRLTSLHVLPCFGPPTLLFSLCRVHRIQPRHRTASQVVCRRPDAIVPGPWRRHCVSGDYEALPERCGINIKPHPDPRYEGYRRRGSRFQCLVGS